MSHSGPFDDVKVVVSSLQDNNHTDLPVIGGGIGSDDAQKNQNHSHFA